MLRNLLNSIQERKKSVNGLVGVIFPVWTPITPVSRNGRRRREPIRPDTPGISGEETRMRIPVVSLPRAMWASERRGGEGSTNERSPPSSVHDFATNERRTKKEIVANSRRARPTRILPTSFCRTWNDRFEFPCSWKERWKGGGILVWNILCSLFVNLLLRLKFTDATGR